MPPKAKQSAHVFLDLLGLFCIGFGVKFLVDERQWGTLAMFVFVLAMLELKSFILETQMIRMTLEALHSTDWARFTIDHGDKVADAMARKKK